MIPDEKIYNKLVRDNIPNIIEAKGKTPIVHTALKGEYLDKLYEKITEELNEFISKPSREEIADILEVVYSICSTYGYNLDEIEKIRREKQLKRGGFEKQIILEKVIG